MAQTPHEVPASDHESDDEILAPSDDDQAPLSGRDVDANEKMLSPAPASRQMSPPKTASAEERRQQIEAAQRALLAPTQSSVESTAAMLPQAPTAIVPATMPSAPETPAPESAGDVWDVPLSDEDDGAVHLVAAKPKAKAPRKRAVTSPNFDIGSDFESPPRKSKRTPASATKPKRSKSTPLGGEGDDDEDDFEPDFGKKTKGRKTPMKSRKNTTEQLVDIPQEGRSRARALRESAQKVNYYIPPPPTEISTPDASPKQPNKVSNRSTVEDNVQISSPNRCPSKSFMIDLTSQVLPPQVRQEYDPVFLESAENSPFEPFVGPVLADSSAVTQPQSTLPDSTLQPTLELPPLPASALDPNFIAPEAPLVREPPIPRHELEPESQPHMEEQIEPATSSTVTKKKKRAQTDMGVYDHRNVVATGWRAAKGKGRPDLADTYCVDRHSGDEGLSIHSDGEERKRVTKARKPKKENLAIKKAQPKKRKKTQTIDLSDTESESIGDTIRVISDMKSAEENIQESGLSSKQGPDTIKDAPRTNVDPKAVEEVTDSVGINPSHRNRRTKSRFIEPEADELYGADTFSTFRKPSDGATPTNTDVPKHIDDMISPTSSSPTQPKVPSKRKRTKSEVALVDDAKAKAGVETAADQKRSRTAKRRKSAKDLKEKEANRPPPLEPLNHSTDEEAHVEPVMKMSTSKPTKSTSNNAKDENERPTVSTPKGTPEPEKSAKEQEDKKEQGPRDPTTPAATSTRTVSEDKSATRGSSKTPGHRQGALHSPIRIQNRQRHRVGLSRTARIEPLLKVVKKN